MPFYSRNTPFYTKCRYTTELGAAAPGTPPDASLGLRKGSKALLGGFPIPIVVTAAFITTAPWLDGRSEASTGPAVLSLSLSPLGANLLL